MENENSILKLVVRNSDDLKTISACLQDSLVKQKEIIFLKTNKIFIMMLNRFMWEDFEKNQYRENRRVKCAVRFNRVHNVTCSNINQSKQDKILELLAIENVLLSDQTFKIKLIFSGNSIITIFVEEIDILLDDLGKSWIANKVPKHNI